MCLPEPDGVYELQACRSDHNAQCSPCEACINGSIYTSRACAEKLDAECSPCTVCAYETQYLGDLCTSLLDSVCRNITFARTCPVGQYAGGHTERTDSTCLPCQYRDTMYFNQMLHQAASPGMHYNDAYSCEIECLGISVMVDRANHSLVCESCEQGNVLLRDFEVLFDDNNHKIECAFTCRPDFEYDATLNDCPSAAPFWSPTCVFSPLLGEETPQYSVLLLHDR